MQARNEELLRKILTSDPIIGDVACQNRAVYLAYLFQKIGRQKALSDADLAFINLASNLSEILIQEREPCELIKDFRTPNPSKLPNKFPAEFASSNKKKQTYLVETKQSVAELCLQFMEKKVEKKMEFEDDVLDVNKNRKEMRSCIISSGKPIPVVPFYASVKMALNIINRRSIDIVAVVRYIDATDPENRVLLDKAEILYQKTEGRYLPSPDQITDLGGFSDISQRRSAIQVEFVEMYNPNKARLNFDDYIQAFKQEDILEKIMIYGGNHQQLLPAAEEKLAPSLAFFKNTAVNPNANVNFNVNACSIQEYETYQLKSTQAGINRNDKRIDHISITSYRPI